MINIKFNKININDIKDYITNKYKYLTYRKYNSLVNVAKTLGFYNFIKGEAEFKKLQESNTIRKARLNKYSSGYTENLISFFISDIFDDKARVKFKKLEFIDEKANLGKNRTYYKKL